MQTVSPRQNLMTSVSLPAICRRRFDAVLKSLRKQGIRTTEQELYRRLLRYYLKFWRGRGLKTNGLRRYNWDGRKYQIRPLYINQVLHAALWQRALHSGESLSRILDVAQRLYLGRLFADLVAELHNDATGSTKQKSNGRNSPAFFINYTCRTVENNARILDYRQNTEIILDADLTHAQRKRQHRIAA